MTREEAIHFAVCLKNNWTIDFNDMEEFCDMAIEALSADAVSRETYHNLVTASNDIDRALREYQDKEENGELVSVVRCKGCEHYGMGNCYMYGGQMNEDDYCSRAERRKK